MCKLNIDLILVSNCIFTGLSETPEKGYVAVASNQIVKVGKDHQYHHMICENTQVIELDNQLVLPGFVDVHTFFTGYAIYHLGFNASEIRNNEECLRTIEQYVNTIDETQSIFGHGWKPEQFKGEGIEEYLNTKYSNRNIVIFSADRSTCIMNQAAKDYYGFTPTECYPEAYHKMMREYLNDRSFIEQEFRNYMYLMNSRGITSVKEMGFDDFYGFAQFLKEQEEQKQLSLRIAFMSQPVGEKINIEHGKRMRDKFTGDFVMFSGYNRMTDGTVASRKGDLLQPYEDTNYCCAMKINYKDIEEEVLEADRNGFRYSLHAQGDGAIHKVLDIYDKCQKDNGKVVQRHAITDMEFSNPVDLERMGQMGIIGEIYFQIMSLDSGDTVKDSICNTIGTERGKYYWNRRKMIDSGVILSGATDLPLMITDIPESIYHGCGGYFPEGGEPFNQQNTITIAEILKAWTYGGQKNLGMEKKLGTLEEGKLADIVVLDQNVFDVPLIQMRDVKVAMTIVDGQCVYKR